MKKHTTLLLIALAIVYTVSAQNRVSESRQDGLLGPVQSVTSYMYEADKNDNGVMINGAPLEHMETIYARNGQRKSMTFLSTVEDVVFRTRYKHDAFGQTTLEHVVDNNEHIIGRTYYIYDQNFVLTESYVEDAERQVENRIRYKYSDGKLSERSYNDPLNNIYRREVYTYNPDGETILKTVVYNRQNKKMQEIRYEYDENRQCTSVTRYDYSEQEPEVTINLYSYQYDDHGNWINRVEYRLESDERIPEYITERTITYHE